MFDTGSQRSYITNELRTRLNLPVLRKDKIMIKTFGNDDSVLEELDAVQLKVKNKLNENFVFIEALCVPFICAPLTKQNIKIAKENHAHLRNIYLADYSDGTIDSPVDVLVGVDYYFSFMSGRVVKGDCSSGPVAMESILGWVVGGCLLNRSGESNSSNVNTTHVMRIHSENVNKNIDLRDELSKFWTIESVEDDLNDAVIEQFKNGKRYVTKLPFKSEHDMLPDNFEMCKQRLKSLKKRLNNNPELLNEYDKIIADYKNKGIVEVVHDPGWDTEPGGVHYLPHRAVIRADKETTKVRVVFDASANVKSTIVVKNNETNDKFYRKVAFPRYTESVKFMSQSRETASKLKPHRGLGTRLPSPS